MRGFDDAIPFWIASAVITAGIRLITDQPPADEVRPSFVPFL